MTEDRLKIAVFIDFDNIEIGVKSTLNRNFDISAVLEAIKERGEIVTKVAYGDWKRSGDYGRLMGQHAISMVQRNPTPGGDKNGADINLALDAFEMAFTRNHINAFVIVGGDSDFMTLVEKLKEYDKKVIVVGGRAFTSVILQKNCHEFIAYENLIRSGRRQPDRSRPAPSETPIEKAIPLVRRALKILTDREVSPQLGLLKSTLLQLDSTFSEQDYGATTFRAFIEKLARTGVIALKQMDRNILVELHEDDGAEAEGEAKPTDARTAKNSESSPEPRAENGSEAADRKTETAPADPERLEQGIERIRAIFQRAEGPFKWPMYLRGARQLLKSYDPDFDERAYGFAGLHDALRHVHKTGFLRLERNRQGVLRIFPGEEIGSAATAEAPVEGTQAGAVHSPETTEEPPAAEAARSTGGPVEETPVNPAANDAAEAAADAAVADTNEEVDVKAAESKDEGAPKKKPAAAKKTARKTRTVKKAASPSTTKRAAKRSSKKAAAEPSA